MNNPRPWLAHYDSGVPANLDYPRQCVHDYITIQAQCNPGRSAVIIGNEITSYKTLHSLVANLACDLIKIGIKPGERVGICLPNSVEFVVAFFAVLQAGGIVAAMNPLFPKRELEFQVDNSKNK